MDWAFFEYYEVERRVNQLLGGILTRKDCMIPVE